MQNSASDALARMRASGDDIDGWVDGRDVVREYDRIWADDRARLDELGLAPTATMLTARLVFHMAYAIVAARAAGVRDNAVQSE